jgi:RNA polymerase sigma factor (sigma-70 family)
METSGTEVTHPATGYPADAVTALYQEYSLGLIRLAMVMLGDRAAAEDVVQEAFYGLYRRWHTLTDTAKALSYVRSSVLNGSRTVLRRRSRPTHESLDPPAQSAEAAVLIGEEHREVLAAIRRLPDRTARRDQREHIHAVAHAAERRARGR